MVLLHAPSTVSGLRRHETRTQKASARSHGSACHGHEALPGVSPCSPPMALTEEGSWLQPGQARGTNAARTTWCTSFCT